MADAGTPPPKRRMDNCVIFVCDLQEKFRNAIYEFDKVVLTTRKVLRAASHLSFPILSTTQNAARLGPTVPELQPYLTAHPPIDKTRFSMLVPPLTALLPAPDPTPTTIVLLGIEAHICITQTALDARAAGHAVYVLADGVSSCNREEVPVALARLRAEGVVVTTSESWLYEVVGDASADEFRGVIKLVKETAQDTKTALRALAPVPAGAGAAKI
ncbi:unnamed protein product [Discula destructiva]